MKKLFFIAISAFMMMSCKKQVFENAKVESSEYAKMYGIQEYYILKNTPVFFEGEIIYDNNNRIRVSLQRDDESIKIRVGDKFEVYAVGNNGLYTTLSSSNIKDPLLDEGLLEAFGDLMIVSPVLQFNDILEKMTSNAKERATVVNWSKTRCKEEIKKELNCEEIDMDCICVLGDYFCGCSGYCD